MSDFDKKVELEQTVIEWRGRRVRYTVIGIVGICTAVCFHRTGSPRLQIEFKDYTGRPCEWWIDAENAELVD